MNNKLVNQKLSTFNNTSLQKLDIQYNESSKEFKENNSNNLPTLGNKQLLEEQKKHFKDNGRISDKYLLP